LERTSSAKFASRLRSGTAHAASRSPDASTENPERGPLLIISGEKDNTVPWAIANASFKRQERNDAVTEIEEIPGRGHAVTIDSGWREVAEKALGFVKRFVPSRQPGRRPARRLRPPAGRLRPHRAR